MKKLLWAFICCALILSSIPAAELLAEIPQSSSYDLRAWGWNQGGSGGGAAARSSSGYLLIDSMAPPIVSAGVSGAPYLSGATSRCYLDVLFSVLTSAISARSNYVILNVSPAAVGPGGTINLSWSCDFGTWNYQSQPVNVYLAAVRNPAVSDAPSSVPDAQVGDMVYFFGPGMVPSTALTGPAFRGIPFPPAPVSGSIGFVLPSVPGFAGDWKFATAFIYSDGRGFVRNDGLPVENSNTFTLQ